MKHPSREPATELKAALYAYLKCPLKDDTYLIPREIRDRVALNQQHVSWSIGLRIRQILCREVT